MKTFILLLSSLFLLTPAFADTPAPTPPAPDPVPAMLVHELRYDGKLTDEEARFDVELRLESTLREESRLTLFEGDLALLPPQLPDGLRIERQGNQYILAVPKAGKYRVRVGIVARVTRAEPWNQVAFRGPAAAIASMEVAARGADLQCLSGTVLKSSATNGWVQTKAFLGATDTISFRWSGAGTISDAGRKPVAIAETAARVQLSPSVARFVTQVKYEILQGRLARLRLALPAAQNLTRLVGEQVRDWELQPAEAGATMQTLLVELIRPVEKAYELTVYSEQAVEGTGNQVSLVPVQPLDVERDTGLVTLETEDVQVELAASTGIRQVNTPAGAAAAYRYQARPVQVALSLKRIEPLLSVQERIGARLEETRLTASHALALRVEKSGLYNVDVRIPAGWEVSDVQGDGVDTWKWMTTPGAAGRDLRVLFSTRILGERQLSIVLERMFPALPERITLAGLKVAGAVRQTSQLGVTPAPGLSLKTLAVQGSQEIPVAQLAARTSELLAFAASQAEWSVDLAPSRLDARVVAEIFNLITIGDGLVGGSATVRYGLVNQGVQEFELQVPPHWKNVDFTGPNIRLKERRGENRWLIGLQDKAWDGYTLVVTYDFQFDPQGAVIQLGGIHAGGAGRETGSLAVTAASSLRLEPEKVSDMLRRMDETELSSANRALITRAVLLAYDYSRPGYELSLKVQRFEEAPVLAAVADRTQLTTVLTENGEMLTQASFMVKNHDKQYQRFKLPAKSTFWSCYVNGQAVKAERDGDWLLAPLPRGANRDEAFAVDVVYAEQRGALSGLWPQPFRLLAPQTDVPNTYAEWHLYAPATLRLDKFGGNMTPALGTTYDVRDAWQRFASFYRGMWTEGGAATLIGLTILAGLTALIVSAVRRGWGGLLSVLGVLAVVAILAAMLLPALSRAKARAQRINAANSLKQIGLAARTFALDNGDRLPASFEQMMQELGTEKLLFDPESGQQFVWVGNGVELGSIRGDSVLAFSPTESGGRRNVLLADGSVQQMRSEDFAEISRRGYLAAATLEEAERNRQMSAVLGQQVRGMPAAAAPPVATDALVATPPPLGQPVSTVTAGYAGGGGGGAVQVAMAPARVAGVKSLRIEVPRAGLPFTFTKVLNVGQEPLAVQASLMRLQTWQSVQMVLQVGCFLVGLLVCVWQWRGARNTLLIALGAALMFGGIGNLLLAWRSLHYGFIWGAPLLVLALLAWAAYRFWPKSRPATPEVSAPIGGTGDTGPAIASIAILCLVLGATGLRAAQPSVSILSATYTGEVTEQVAQVDAVLRVRADTAGQRIPLFGAEVAVQHFDAKPSDAKLLRAGDLVSVVLPRKGEATLRFVLLIKTSGEVTRRNLAFAIPPALTSQLNLTIQQAEADVDFPGAVAFKRVAEQNRTLVNAVLGATDRVELRWTPRVKRASETAANVNCQASTLVTLGTGALNARTFLDYQVTQGELRQCQLRIPAGYRLLRVEGDQIRTWEVRSENDVNILVVDLLKGMPSEYRLTVETERLQEALPASITAQVPRPLEVKRETGWIALRTEEELELTIEKSADLHRIEMAEFNRASGQTVTNAVNAFRYLDPGFDLQMRLAPAKAELEAALRHFAQIAPGRLSLSAEVDFVIKRAGVFAVRLGLPAGFKVESISGPKVLQWTERGADASRWADVRFSERMLGTCNLQVQLSQDLDGLPASITIPGLNPLDATKSVGWICVAADPGIALKPGVTERLSEVPADAAGCPRAAQTAPALAFKFITTDASESLPWRLTVTPEDIPASVRSEIVNIISVSESLITGRAIVRYEIQNSPVKELALRIPAAFRNVEISGQNIRRRDQEGEVWRIGFQSKVRGHQVLTITWDQPRGEGDLVALSGVNTAQAERETGMLVIHARPPLQVTHKASTDLTPADTRELPEWAGRPDDTAVLAYRYVRPGYSLSLEARRFAEAEVLQAIVQSASLRTVVADDGQMMTEMSLAVRNNGRQHLEIALPAGASVWSAFVAGQPVRPTFRDGKLMLPLEPATDEDAPLNVSLTYVGTNRFPRTAGAFGLTAPRLDVPLKGARWELFLPPDYSYGGFAGTMSRETGVAAPEAASFSSVDYQHRESQVKAELAKEQKDELLSAKRKLSAGKVREAYFDYSRARAKGELSQVPAAETKRLEEDLRRAQGSNLVMAQNEFNIENNAAIAGRDAQAPQSAAKPAYNMEAAEAQWTKLQQAQDLGGTRAQPIHVNLPTRGLRFTFTQVLQAEAGKAMTIEMTASNDKQVSWLKRAGLGLAGFLVLWGLATLLVRCTPSRSERLAAAA